MGLSSTSTAQGPTEGFTRSVGTFVRACAGEAVGTLLRGAFLGGARATNANETLLNE